jgi:putative Mg2+ transporter-C (MgtC) family protein
MPLNVFVFRLACALIAGIIIGTQRELKQRQAGLTTNSLVAVGACIFILISESVIMNAKLAGGPVNNDNLRVLSQVVTGIGFLGAGSIMKNRNHVTGLTTAAGLWATAGMGLCAGAGYLECAILMCVIIYIALVPLYKLDAMHVKTAHVLMVYRELSPDLRLSSLMKSLGKIGMQLNAIEPFGSNGEDYCGYRIEVEMVNQDLDIDHAMRKLSCLDEVLFVQHLSERRS